MVLRTTTIATLHHAQKLIGDSQRFRIVTGILNDEISRLTSLLKVRTQIIQSVFLLNDAIALTS